jgi:tripartite-type tricarboxylate transporter receptor subunit TctC
MRPGACTSSLFLLALVAVSLDCIEAVRAQAYPSRPIKIVVPFPPGGPTDVMARLIVQPMTSKLGQSVIVENQPGAGGRSGSRAVASANPDGYTLLIGGTNINAIIPALYKNLSYDPIKGYAAVAAIASDAGVLVVARPSRRRRFRNSSSTPRTIRASCNMAPRPASARTSRRNCSSSRPAPTSSTFPTKAVLRPSPI